jgi:dipeptidase E
VVAGPTIKTTNDRPLVQPPTFDALGLVPFQINPHYLDVPLSPDHMGETRSTRLREYCEENTVPVVGLPEGNWLRVFDGVAYLGGEGEAMVFAAGLDEPCLVQVGSDVAEICRTVCIRADCSN